MTSNNKVIAKLLVELDVKEEEIFNLFYNLRNILEPYDISKQDAEEITRVLLKHLKITKGNN